jgi:hypothetical protein
MGKHINYVLAHLDTDASRCGWRKKIENFRRMFFGEQGEQLETEATIENCHLANYYRKRGFDVFDRDAPVLDGVQNER